jgi:lipopolysaccharide assembly protein B
MLDLLLPLVLLLLPIAAWSGYRIGRKRSQGKPSTRRLPQGYFTGLNYVLNEQPDKAIDTFIRMLEVDSETVETHLALGNLYRRRGEVDRAIRIHQNLIARPSLAGELRNLALAELATDYMAAGLFDRAESLCRELVKDPNRKQDSLQQLLTIYQQIKDWDKAIEITQMIAQSKGVNQDKMIAHFYCEQALEFKDAGNFKKAYDALKRALQADNNAVRASILQGQLYQQEGKHKDAIKSYQRIRHQDVSFLPEVLMDLIVCYRLTGGDKKLLAFLRDCLEQGAGVSVLLAVAELLEAEAKDEQAAQVIAQYLKDRPSLKGLEHLIKLHVEHASGPAKENLKLLQDLVIKLIDKKPVYKCEGCGFSGKTLFWQCPSCKEWGSIKPIFGIEGE